VSTDGLRMGMRPIGLREVRGVEASETSEPDFTGVTVPKFPHPVSESGCRTRHWWQRWIEWHIGW
jgi:hypothetical protein